jgi:hypothetical protein
MALIATLQLNHPGITLAVIAGQAHLGLARLRSINAGRRAMRFMEQLAVEALLPHETVASIRSRYYNADYTKPFWQRYLDEGTTHARSQ